MFKLKVEPTGQTYYVDESKSLLEHLRENSVYVKSSCGGHASCTDCIIKVLDGKDSINEPTFDETKLLGNVFHITKERLACQCFINGEVTIDISAHDKGAHEEKQRDRNRKKRNMAQVKVRKQSEVKEIIEERKARVKEKHARQDTWKNHWEKNPEGIKVEKSLGGGKRPTKMKDLDLEREKWEKRKKND
jgi:ferredoxin